MESVIDTKRFALHNQDSAEYKDLVSTSRKTYQANGKSFTVSVIVVFVDVLIQALLLFPDSSLHRP